MTTAKKAPSAPQTRAATDASVAAHAGNESKRRMVSFQPTPRALAVLRAAESATGRTRSDLLNALVEAAPAALAEQSKVAAEEQQAARAKLEEFARDPSARGLLAEALKVAKRLKA